MIFRRQPNIKKLKAKGDVIGLINALCFQRDRSIRRDAAEALLAINLQLDDEVDHQQVIEDLILVLNINTAAVRKAAEGILVKLGIYAVDPLLDALRDEDPLRRVSAARALSRMDVPLENTVLSVKIGEALIIAMDDEDMNVRRAATTALKQAALIPADNDLQVKVVDAFINALRDPIPEIVGAALEALGQMILCLENPALRSSALEALVFAMRVKDLPIRQNAVRILGLSWTQINDHALQVQILKALIAALRDQHTTIRQDAARTLGQLGALVRAPALQSRIVSALIATLQHQDLDFRQVSAAALVGIYRTGQLGEPDRQKINSQKEVINQSGAMTSDTRSGQCLNCGKTIKLSTAIPYPSIMFKDFKYYPPEDYTITIYRYFCPYCFPQGPETNADVPDSALRGTDGKIIFDRYLPKTRLW